MSNALAKPGARVNSTMAEVSRSFEANAATITALLPAEITIEKMKAITLTSLRKTPALLKCSPRSIMSCIYESCKIGLAPDTATQDCHLIPRGGEATFLLGYRGLLKLVRRAAPGIPIKAEHVCEEDAFTWVEGLNPVLEHVRAKAGGRGKVTHAYAIATLPGGEKVFKVVDEDDISRARKTANSTAWQHHEGAMFEKTALRRLCKTLPMGDAAGLRALSRAITLDEALDDDRPQELGEDFALEGEDDGIIDAEHTERGGDEYKCKACGTYSDADHAKGCPEAP